MVESAQRTWVSYNGHPGMTVKERGIVNPGELMCGVIPALYAPRLEQALVLGHGTGITSGTASHIFKHTDVVEINQAFYLMTPDVKYANFDIMDNPAAKLHLADGRAFLVDKKERYDVIINSISAPTYFTASKIYTLEFYERVQTALKPDGIFCTWLSSHDMTAEGVDTVLSALHQNFRYCNLSIMRLGYYLAVCSNEPVEARRFSELSMPEAAVNELKKAVPGLDLDSFFEDIRISENVFDHYQPDVPHENTDDRPVLEFMVFRSFKEGNMGEDPFLTRQELLNIDPVRMHELKDQSELIRKAKAFFLVSPRYCTENFLPILNRHLPSMAQFLQWKSDHLNSKGTPGFGTEYDLGMVYLKLEQYDQAVAQFRRALKINPRHAQLHNSIGVALYFQQQLPEAIRHYEEALRLQPNYPRAQENRRKAWEQLKSDQRAGSEP
jgi:spermidine synthase